jgi:predicted DCC family thiol-disulfide oxidoreductase YuxK
MAQFDGFNEFSWRTDPAVPRFRDSGTIAFMDGACVLCMTGARMIDRFDSTREVGISPTQSDLGNAILKHFDMAPEDPDSWLVLDNGRAYTALDAIIHLGRKIGGIGNVLRIFSILPKPLRDWLYRRLARNRFAILGRRRTCELPTPTLQARLIEPY